MISNWNYLCILFARILIGFRIAVLLVVNFFQLLQGHQYETVSGFLCENFGYIPKIGEWINVVLERKNEDSGASNTDPQHQKETFNIQVISLFSAVLHLCQRLWILIHVSEYICKVDRIEWNASLMCLSVIIV